MFKLCSFFLYIFSISFLFGEETDVQQVIIVANNNDEASVRIAHYYAKRRSIPKKNIVLLDTPIAETISWEEFVNFIFNPLRRKLIENQWLNGFCEEEKDPIGRYTYIHLGHSIDFLILCRGIPYRISEAKAIPSIGNRSNLKKEFCVNHASVDSELALLTASESEIEGFINNPLYQQKQPQSSKLHQVIKIGRLDGPSEASAKHLVDRAIKAEKYGLKGNVFMDIWGPYQKGNVWLEEMAKDIRSKGFTISISRDKSAPVEAKDAAFYFGWWQRNPTKTFLSNKKAFLPGAVGVHIHSFSAEHLRSKTENWVGPLIERGVTATVGNVYEPYLELTHQLPLLWEALRNGMRWGDATYYALPALSWQTIAIGDPLYQPF